MPHSRSQEACRHECLYVCARDRDRVRERETERKRRDPFATEFDLPRTSVLRGRVLSLLALIYTRNCSRENQRKSMGAIKPNKELRTPVCVSARARSLAQLHKRGIMQFYTMETWNEICNYKRIHRLYPHFASPYCYHPSFTFRVWDINCDV